MYTKIKIIYLIVSFGLTIALFTLIPQCIGSNRIDLIAHYVQRVFLISLLVLIPTIIIQVYSGEIICFILGYDSNDDKCGIIKKFNIYLLPNIFFSVWYRILQVTIQCMNFNTPLFIIISIITALNPVFNHVFINVFNIGYLGCALSMNLNSLLTLISCIMLLLMKNCGYIFKPVSLKILLNTQKIKEYIGLALPGLAAVCSEWWLAELISLLSGYVGNPNITVSATVICYLIYEFLVGFRYEFIMSFFYE